MKQNTAELDIPPVNRAKEISTIRNILQKLINNIPEFGTIINYFGVPGIGKTTLGKMIGNISSVLDVPYTRIDFDPDENPWAEKYETNHDNIIKNMFEGFTECESSNFSNQFRKDNSINLNNFLSILLAYTEKYKPLVMIFDTSEKANEKIIRWIEERIINPLSLTGKCLIIWTGRFPQKWSNFEVRRRTICQPLESLNIESTKQQIRSINPVLTKHGCRIFNLTDGHPLGNKKLIEELISKPTLKDEELLDILFKKVINEYMLEDVEHKLKEACRVLSIVRQFDIIILEDLLSEFVKGFTVDSPFMTTTGKLTKTSLVYWNGERKGYSLEKTVGHILRLHMITHEKDRFIKITEKTLNIYEQRIKIVPENRIIYIGEWLWHYVNLCRYMKYCKKEILEKFEIILQEHYPKKNQVLIFYLWNN